MKLQKLVLFVAALMFLATSAFAANRVEVKVTSEPIKEDSPSDKAGGFSLEFDPGTEILVNDTITIDTTLYTTLSKDVVDFVNGNTESLYVYNNDGSAETGSMQWRNATVADDGRVVFRVRGIKGTQRITVTLLHGSVRVDNIPNAFFKINFLDQAADDDLIVAKDYNQTTDTFVTPRAVQVADNTLCIDVSDDRFVSSVVRGSMDSAGDKFTFIPSDPQIAHIVLKDSYTRVNCNKQVLPWLCMGGLTGQTGETAACDNFDIDGPLGDSVDGLERPADLEQYYDWEKNRLMIRSQNGWEAGSDYYVELQILVDGSPNDAGVYWASNVIGFASQSLANADGIAALCNKPTEVWADATAKLANGVNGTAASGGASCTVPSTNRVNMLTTLIDPSTFDLNGGDQLLKINLPAMRYDINTLPMGSTISVKATIKKTPCTTVTTQTMPIALVRCKDKEGKSSQVIFPYFTQMAGDMWWDGIVITNLGSNSGTAVLDIYEEDGDKGQFTTPTIKPYSMYVNTLEDIAPLVVPTAGNVGTLGDTTLWIKATAANMDIDGFAMIGDPASGQSMGYLPRRAWDY